MNRTTVRLGGVLIATAGLLLPTAAWAHVSVSSTDAARDGYGKVVFRVPNESETAATKKITVTLPEDAPFASLTTQVKPGWTAKIARAKLAKPTKVGDATLSEAPRTVTWTATGDGIKPGEFDEFALSGGPFPDADSLRFSAKQSYDDGEVVDWSQVQKGDEEPEHPAPTLQLLAASGDGHGSAHGSSATEDGSTGAEHADSKASASDTTSRVLAMIALVVAAVAVGFGILRGRRA